MLSEPNSSNRFRGEPRNPRNTTGRRPIGSECASCVILDSKAIQRNNQRAPVGRALALLRRRRRRRRVARLRPNIIDRVRRCKRRANKRLRKLCPTPDARRRKRAPLCCALCRCRRRQTSTHIRVRRAPSRLTSGAGANLNDETHLARQPSGLHHWAAGGGVRVAMAAAAAAAADANEGRVRRRQICGAQRSRLGRAQWANCI